MIKKIALFSASLLFGAGLLVWSFRLIGWPQIKSAFLIFTGWHGVAILLITVVMLLLGTWRWKVLLESQGYRLKFRQLISPHIAEYAFTYLFPMFIVGGEIFKGSVLKDQFSIPWKEGITSIVIDKILEFTAALAVIFVGSAFFLLRIGLPPQEIGIIFGGGVLLISLAIGFLYFKIVRGESIVKPAVKFFNGKELSSGGALEVEKEIFSFFRPNNKALWRVSVITFFRVAVTGLRCWILILFLGKNIGLLSTLPVLGFYYFVFIVPIPMALGSHELIQTFAFSALGVGAGLAPVFTMIIRAAELLLVFIGMAIFCRLGIGLLYAAFFRRIGKLTKIRRRRKEIPSQ